MSAGGAAAFVVLLFVIIVGTAAFFVIRAGSDVLSALSPEAPTQGQAPGTGPPTSRAPSSGRTTTGAQPEPDAVPLTAPGEAATVQFGQNSYRITMVSAAAQLVPAWGSIGTAETVTVDLTLERTDDNARVDQISWFDWEFTEGPPGSAAPPLSGELIGGGYGPSMSTLRLEPDETAWGAISFASTANEGVLRLQDGPRTVGQWLVPILTVEPAVGKLGAAVRTNAAELPFVVTVSDPRWVATGSAELATDPRNGYLLILSTEFTSRRQAGTDAADAWVEPRNWQFTTASGSSFPGGHGTVGRTPVSSVQVQGGATVQSAILLDVPGEPGTLALVGGDGRTVISWTIPGP